MMKTLFFSVMLSLTIFTFSGCSFPGGSSSNTGSSIMKSTDGGKTYEPRVTIDEKTKISSANILSFVFEKGNSERITIGTVNDGLFVTDNGGEKWSKLIFPPTRSYGLISDWSRPERLYASGVWEGRAKLYKSDDRGGKWDEIYTEPFDGTVITALVQSPRNPAILYIGTSAGVIVKTTDGGVTWANLKGDTAPVLSMTFDAGGDLFYILFSNKGVYQSKDGGATIEPIGKNDDDRTIDASILPTSSEIVSIAVDPSHSGVVYIGTKSGLFRSANFGDSWMEMNIIESSKKFPIRSIAVDPKNSSHIVYSAALAVYKSVDGGLNWATYQLDADRTVGTIRYSPSDSSVVYLGFRTYN